MRKLFKFQVIIVLAIALFACTNDNEDDLVKDPDKAKVVSVDRFSDVAGTLMKRSENPSLPEANVPINFDTGDFITQSYGPNGEIVKYYNFDVQGLVSAPLYVLYREDETEPVEGQLNIINVIPGDAGYNDFWIVYKVSVPSNYKANSISSLDEIIRKDYTIEKTTEIVNCPVIPYGSTASLRLGSEPNNADRGWYKDQIVYYFNFMEKPIHATIDGTTPTSPIYVTFNINPDEGNPDSGPPSGIITEPGSLQTHNVIATIPSDENYSPLWSVFVYDNNDFDNVSNLQTVLTANILLENAMYVNCPVVYIEE